MVDSAPARSVVPRAIEARVHVVVVCAALSSGAALVASILLDRPLWLTSSFILVPGLVAFVGASVMARRHEQLLFLARVRSGAAAGVLATLAYDASRWVVETLELSSTRSFVAMPIFGSGLTGLAPPHALAHVAGWAFHFVNGIGFALAYVLVAAGRSWVWAVGYALVLEAFMVSLYPSWLGVELTSEFLSVSILGHVCYGTVLGARAERTP